MIIMVFQRFLSINLSVSTLRYVVVRRKEERRESGDDEDGGDERRCGVGSFGLVWPSLLCFRQPPFVASLRREIRRAASGARKSNGKRA